MVRAALPQHDEVDIRRAHHGENYMPGYHVFKRHGVDLVGRSQRMGDNSDGLIIADHECNEYYTAKRYNALAHFSKFVPVGSKVISNEKDVNDRVAWKIKNQMGFVILNKTNCASFLTPDGSIVVVIVNDDAGCTFNFEGISGRDNLKIYTTNDQYDLKLTYDGEYKQEVEIPGLSITTLIFS